MEKKISFGFSKISKKSNLLLNKIEPKDDKNKIELIECLEGQAIQLVEKKGEEAPLIIPLKDSGKTSAALLSLRTRQAVINGEEILNNEKEVKKELPPELNGIEDINKRAARELLAEVNKGDEKDSNESSLVLPLKAEDLPLDGAKESTIDDYESIPITEFGKAMLRGMGWKDQPKKKSSLIEEGPVVRPKGMGLGADKALKHKALLVPPEANEILEIKKGACVLVLGGKNKNLYGQVEGLDDHAGRVIVKMALGGSKESFNEFMVQPVSKKEYSQYSKCINSVKYDEYKRMENEYGQILPKKENLKNDDFKRSEENQHLKVKKEDTAQKYNGHNKDDDKLIVISRQNNTERRSRSRDRRDEEYARSSTSHKKCFSQRTHSRHRSKSNDSLSSSESTSNRKKYKKKTSKSKKNKKNKDKKREKRHSSDSSSDDERRHKKKTKKSKRERSRSRSKCRR